MFDEAKQYSKKLLVTAGNEYYTEPEDDDNESTYSPKPIVPNAAAAANDKRKPAVEDDLDIDDEDEEGPVDDDDEDYQPPVNDQHHDEADDDNDDDEEEDGGADEEDEAALVVVRSAHRKRTKSICEPPPAKETASKRRRQTIDTMNVKKRVLEHSSAAKDVPAKLMESFSLNKQVIIDYNLLAYCESRPVDPDDSVMEARMAKFIQRIKANYKGIQHVEYKINNKLFCVLDIVYFLPILFRQFEQNERADRNSQMLKNMVERLDLLSDKILGPDAPSVMPAAAAAPPTPKPSPAKSSMKRSPAAPAEKNITFKIPPVPKAKKAPSAEAKPAPATDGDTRNIRLYLVGADYYLMCRKRQNFVDGQKNLEKKYGQCKLLKTWDNRTNVKEIGKLIHRKFPQLQWNARTNIITNSPDKAVTENELLTFISKVIE